MRDKCGKDKSPEKKQKSQGKKQKSPGKKQKSPEQKEKSPASSDNGDFSSGSDSDDDRTFVPEKVVEGESEYESEGEAEISGHKGLCYNFYNKKYFMQNICIKSFKEFPTPILHLSS